MKHLSKVSLFAIVLLSSGPIGASEMVTRTVEDTVETTAYYTEQTLRLLVINWFGEAIRKGVPATKVVEDIFQFVDKVPLVGEWKLRTKLQSVVWGALGLSVLRAVSKQKDLRRALDKNAPWFTNMLDGLLTFRSIK